jgi:NAD(P)-dependent dehydrogenase (short-subunit alcohol dehydrogenase family)
MERLADKVAIVTGAAQGIGEGIARALAREGARLALWDISERVHETAKAINSSGQEASAYLVDVAEADQTNQTAKDVSERFGKVNILVNNAGIAHFAPFVEMTDEFRDKVFNVNFNGVWNCTKAVIPMMIEQNDGRIINISSVTGPRVGDPGLTAYSAAKGAVSAFTRTLALEAAAFGITVNAILPGYIETSLLKPMAEVLRMSTGELAKRLANSIPMKRLGTTEEMGNLAVYLASDESRYVTGQEIVIDGGNIIQEKELSLNLW